MLCFWHQLARRLQYPSPNTMTVPFGDCHAGL
jgi:hypothetical protein